MIQLKRLEPAQSTYPHQDGSPINRFQATYEVIHSTADGPEGPGTTMWADVGVTYQRNYTDPDIRWQASISLTDVKQKPTCQAAILELARYLERVATGIREGLEDEAVITAIPICGRKGDQ